MTDKLVFTVTIGFTGPIADRWHVHQTVLQALVDWVSTAGLVADEEEEITRYIRVDLPGDNDWTHYFFPTGQEKSND